MYITDTWKLLKTVVFTEGKDASKSRGGDLGETIRVSREQWVVDSHGRQGNPLPPPPMGNPSESHLQPRFEGHFSH